MMKTCIVLCSLAMVLSVAGLASADIFKTGGDRLVAMQNKDGGWDWPLCDRDPNVSNASNVLAPIGMGLLQAYVSVADPNQRDANQLAALKKAGGYLLKKKVRQITPDDGYFAVALDSLLGVTTHSDCLKEKFYKPLAAGTFNYNADLPVTPILVNTSDYVAIMRWMRATQEIPNLAALDCGIGLFSARLIGADTAAWIAGTKGEVDELNSHDVYDVIGLGGAVFGLASAGENINPSSGSLAAANSLADLAVILAGYQLSTGGFTWNSQNKKEGALNETIQETVFGILALNKCDSQKYLPNIQKAEAYLKSVVLLTGGWEDFFGDGENNEVTGCALWALGVAQQAQVKKP